jgi:FkbM family methyltransferase
MTLNFGTQEEILKRLNRLFPKFDLIIDVGAAIGSWTKSAHQIWHGVDILAIEPQPSFFNKLCSEGDAKFFRNFVVSNKCGPISFNVSEDGWSSSLLYTGISIIDSEAHTLECILKDISKGKDKIFVKTDLQGHDLVALKSMGRFLEYVDVVQMECQTAPYVQGMSGLTERIIEMSDLDFEVYEIFEPIYRPSDSALGQVDVVFLKKELDLLSKFNW